MVSESGEPSKTASPEAPEYHKFPQEPKSIGGTQFWAINVDEGWRSWILCCDMYEWAADGMLKILRESGATWPR